MKEAPKTLSEDCWESILNRLSVGDDDYEHLQAPSLVCKQFLTISDRLRRKLVYRHDCENLFRTLQRFRNLNEIELRDPVYGHRDDVNYPIRQIASSGLDLQSLSLRSLRKSPFPKTFRKLGSKMNNLKILRCVHVKSFRNHDLVAIADAFPWLEELDIQFSGSRTYLRQGGGSNSKSSKYIVTDSGIEVMSNKLKNLRKIDICGQGGCTDRSLIALSSNCVLLREIRCVFCGIVTEHGICFVLRHSRNLTSFKAGHYHYHSLLDNPFTFENSMIYARSLRDLDVLAHEDQDRILSSLTKASIPLEKIAIFEDLGVSLHGLTTFLCACPSLKRLELLCISFLNNKSLRDLCQYLPNLESIRLSSCPNITTAAFFILANECPALLEIELSFVVLEIENDFDMDLERNYRITSLDLSGNLHLNDELLKKIGIVCPNLQTLNVEGPTRVTKDGIGEILKCCAQIKHLTVDGRREMEIFLEQFKTRYIKIVYY